MLSLSEQRKVTVVSKKCDCYNIHIYISTNGKDVDCLCLQSPAYLLPSLPWTRLLRSGVCLFTAGCCFAWGVSRLSASLSSSFSASSCLIRARATISWCCVVWIIFCVMVIWAEQNRWPQVW